MSKQTEFGFFIYRLFIMFMLGLALFLSCKKAMAAEVFQVRNLSFTTGKYTSPANVRDSYLNTPKDFHLIAMTKITWDVDLLCGYRNDFCFFWNNNVEGKSAQAAFKYVHWETESGVAMRYLDVGYYHKSQHILEEERPQKAYPIEDVLFIRLKFITNPRY